MHTNWLMLLDHCAFISSTFTSGTQALSSFWDFSNSNGNIKTHNGLCYIAIIHIYITASVRQAPEFTKVTDVHD